MILIAGPSSSGRQPCPTAEGTAYGKQSASCSHFHGQYLHNRSNTLDEMAEDLESIDIDLELFNEQMTRLIRGRRWRSSVIFPDRQEEYNGHIIRLSQDQPIMGRYSRNND